MQRAHRELKAWQQAMTLVESVYALTATFPVEERYGLVSQLRRAAVSVPCNIAEGFARNGSKELLQFLAIAGASLSELDTLLELAQRLGFSPADNDLRKAADDVA
jgi:four helix bundle protein